MHELLGILVPPVVLTSRDPLGMFHQIGRDLVIRLRILEAVAIDHDVAEEEDGGGEERANLLETTSAA